MNSRMKALIYDLEIIKAIPERNGQPESDIEYCAGWQDHANMGISVCCGYEYDSGRYRVFCLDNLYEFSNAVNAADIIIGFNNIAFDNAVIRACWQPLVKLPEKWEEKSYDLLREIWVAAGLAPTFNFKTHGGFGLDAMCEANFGTKKSGNGALAPKWWQRKMIGNVIDYCLNDVALTKQLFDHVLKGHPLVNPNDKQPLHLANPFPK